MFKWLFCHLVFLVFLQTFKKLDTPPSQKLLTCIFLFEGGFLMRCVRTVYWKVFVFESKKLCVLLFTTEPHCFIFFRKTP